MAIKNRIEEVRAKRQEIRAFLENIPYSKVDNYIDQHINDLKSAKAFLKKLTKIVLFLIKEG